MRVRQIHKGWWVLLCILILGFWVQLSGYNNGLVVKDWDEELIYVNMLYRLEGGKALDKDELIGYPPLIFVLHEAAHRLTADPSRPLLTPHLLPTISLLKVWAACINCLTLVILVLCGRLLSGWRVGLSAALIWILLPGVAGRTVLGLTEAWQVCAITLSAYFMLISLYRGHRGAAVASTGAALVALLFKYSNIPVFGLGIAVTLWYLWHTYTPAKSHISDISPRVAGWQLWRRRSAFSQWVIVLALQVVLIGLGGFVMLHGVTGEDAALIQTGRETTHFFDGHLWEYLTNFSNMAYIWRSAAGQLALRPYDISLGLSLFVTGIALVLMPVTWKRLGLALIWGLAIIHLIFLNIYLVWILGVQRYTTPPSALWVLVIVTSVSWIIRAMNAQGWGRSGQWLFAIGLVVWLTPAFAQSAKIALLNTQPNTQEAYMRWVDSTLPQNGALLIAQDDWWAFNHIYWEKPVTRVWVQGLITDLTRQEWLDKGILYATVTQTELDKMNIGTDHQQDLAAMKRLKTFLPSGGTAEALYIYYLPTLQIPAEGTVTFDNGLTLHGCRLKDESHEGQKQLGVQCLWQASQVQTQTWKLYAHIVPLDSREPIAQADGSLVLPTRPEATWTDPQEVLVGPNYTIPLPADLDPHSIRLLIGLYNAETGARATQNGADFVDIPLPAALFSQQP